jgi:hypothetical protein
VASDALSSETTLKGIKQYVIQYDMLSITKIPQGISAEKFTPAIITPSTKWLCTIDDYYDHLKDYQYAAWQEFILCHSTAIIGLKAEVESDLTNLPNNQCGFITMLWFIMNV